MGETQGHPEIPPSVPGMESGGFEDTLLRESECTARLVFQSPPYGGRDVALRPLLAALACEGCVAETIQNAETVTEAVIERQELLPGDADRAWRHWKAVAREWRRWGKEKGKSP